MSFTHESSRSHVPPITSFLPQLCRLRPYLLYSLLIPSQPTIEVKVYRWSQQHPDHFVRKSKVSLVLFQTPVTPPPHTKIPNHMLGPLAPLWLRCPENAALDRMQAHAITGKTWNGLIAAVNTNTSSLIAAGGQDIKFWEVCTTLRQKQQRRVKTR